jgi:4-amino-4-deoxy-L-arabinose transferase-like glycosyltransferase
VAIAAGVLLSLYMGLALGYSDAIPLFEAQDEPAHLHHALFVHETWRIPEPDRLEVPGADAQPPLVYAVAAPLLGATRIDPGTAAAALRGVGLELYWSEASLPESAALRVMPHGAYHFATDGSLAGLRRMRVVSLAFGLLAVTFSFAAVWRVGRDARLALLAASLLAFNPQFLFVSGFFSNDTATAAIGAATLWLVLRAIEEGGPSRNQYIGGAALIGLGCLTRVATLPGLAVAAMTIVAIDRRPQRERRVDLAVAVGIVVLLAGPFGIWGLNRGDITPVGAPMPMAAPVPSPEQVGSVLRYLTDVYFVSTFETFWGRFGWLDLAVPSGVLLVLFTLNWTALLGYYAGREREPNALLRDRALHTYLLCAISLTALAHLAANLFITPSDGRALFAIAPQLGLLLALGLGRLLGDEGRTLTLTVSVVATLVAIDLYCLRGVLIPAYF